MRVVSAIPSIPRPDLLTSGGAYLVEVLHAPPLHFLIGRVRRMASRHERSGSDRRYGGTRAPAASCFQAGGLCRDRGRGEGAADVWHVDGVR